MGVKLNYSLSRFWNIDHASWTAYSGNRAVLWLKVTVMSFTVVFGLVLVLLVPLVVLGLVLALLLRGA